MAINTSEARASTCGFLQSWVLPGMQAGSTGTGWRQVSGHVYSQSIVKAPGPHLQDGNRYARRILGLRNVQGF